MLRKDRAWTRYAVFGLVPLLGVGATGCPGRPSASPETPEGHDDALRPRDDLRWKRVRALERDLARALELPEDALCKELGRFRCLRLSNGEDAEDWARPDLGGTDGLFDLEVPGGVHLVALGGHDPFFQNQHVGPQEPMVTTPAALDRVVLSACHARLTQDLDGPPRVFHHLPLASDETVDPGDEALAAQHTELLRRLLARDPSPEELAALKDLAPAPARQLALLSCYVVGTAAEAVFQ